RVALRAAGAHVGGGEAVVHLAAVEDVAERVQVGVRHAVRRDGEVVRRASGLRHVAAAHHEVLHGADVLGAGHGGERQRAAHGDAVAHGGGGAAAHVRRDEVERAALILRAPAAPVLHLLKDLLHIAAGGGYGLLCRHAALPPA